MAEQGAPRPKADRALSADCVEKLAVEVVVVI
jgi:hypothetical protein